MVRLDQCSSSSRSATSTRSSRCTCTIAVTGRVARTVQTAVLPNHLPVCSVQYVSCKHHAVMFGKSNVYTIQWGCLQRCYAFSRQSSSQEGAIKIVHWPSWFLRAPNKQSRVAPTDTHTRTRTKVECTRRWISAFYVRYTMGVNLYLYTYVHVHVQVHV